MCLSLQEIIVSLCYHDSELFFHRSCYQDGALLLSEEAQILAGIFLGLNAIDFK